MLDHIRPISRLRERQLVQWALMGLEDDMLERTEVERELASVSLMITAPASPYRGIIERMAARLMEMNEEATDH